MSFKIYQLHKRYGEWEDYCDYIIGSYLKKERAEVEKIKAELEEEELIRKAKKCVKCPYLESFDDINMLLNKYPDYCSEADLEYSDYGINCNSYYTLWDRSYYEIEEIEVIE